MAAQCAATEANHARRFLAWALVILLSFKGSVKESRPRAREDLSPVIFQSYEIARKQSFHERKIPLDRNRPIKYLIIAMNIHYVEPCINSIALNHAGLNTNGSPFVFIRINPVILKQNTS